MPTILDVKGVGPTLAAELAKQRILTSEQLAGLRADDLLNISGVGSARANLLIAAAKAVVEGRGSAVEVKTERFSSGGSKPAKANMTAIPTRHADSKSKPKSSAVDPVTRALKKEVKKRQAALEKQKAKLKRAKRALKELK